MSECAAKAEPKKTKSRSFAGSQITEQLKSPDAKREVTTTQVETLAGFNVRAVITRLIVLKMLEPHGGGSRSQTWHGWCKMF